MSAPKPNGTTSNDTTSKDTTSNDTTSKDTTSNDTTSGNGLPLTEDNLNRLNAASDAIQGGQQRETPSLIMNCGCDGSCGGGHQEAGVTRPTANGEPGPSGGQSSGNSGAKTGTRASAARQPKK